MDLVRRLLTPTLVGKVRASAAENDFDEDYLSGSTILSNREQRVRPVGLWAGAFIAVCGEGGGAKVQRRRERERDVESSCMRTCHHRHSRRLSRAPTTLVPIIDRGILPSMEWVFRIRLSPALDTYETLQVIQLCLVSSRTRDSSRFVRNTRDSDKGTSVDRLPKSPAYRISSRFKLST